MAIIAIAIVCAVAALCSLLFHNYAVSSRIALAGSAVTLALTLIAAFGYADFGLPPMGWIKIGGLSGYLLALIGLVQFGAVLTSVGYLRTEMEEGIVTLRQARWYYAMVPLFVLSMAIAVSADSLGLMWIAIEGTTLATTMLVAFYTKEGSLEAAWKYILVCSAGIAIGLIGILLFFYAAVVAGAGESATSVTWSGLLALAHSLPPGVVKLAFVFAFIGFGAKVGIVPMHTWLPDAHGRTPSPVSGMLSGVLLPVALLAIIKARIVVDSALGSSAWTDGFFAVFGALTVIVPVFFMIRQGNYKRMLAYSSVEHMGLAVFSLSLGQPGLAFAAIHLGGHALAKSTLFFGTGHILNAYGSTKLEKVSGVAKHLPVTGTLFALGVLMLLAIPPSPLFFSELGAVGAGIGAHPVATAIVLLGIVIAGGSFFTVFMPMLFEGRDGAAPAHPHKESLGWGHAAMAWSLALLAAFGIALLAGPGFAWIGQVISSV